MFQIEGLMTVRNRTSLLGRTHVWTSQLVAGGEFHPLISRTHTLIRRSTIGTPRTYDQNRAFHSLPNP
jgi:hypothetical protein